MRIIHANKNIDCVEKWVIICVSCNAKYIKIIPWTVYTHRWHHNAACFQTAIYQTEKLPNEPMQNLRCIWVLVPFSGDLVSCAKGPIAVWWSSEAETLPTEADLQPSPGKSQDNGVSYWLLIYELFQIPVGQGFLTSKFPKTHQQSCLTTYLPPSPWNWRCSYKPILPPGRLSKKILSVPVHSRKKTWICLTHLEK